MTKLKIHVRPDVISRNRFYKENNPPIVIHDGEQEYGAHQIEILDESGRVAAKIIHDPSVIKGASVWIETSNKITYK